MADIFLFRSDDPQMIQRTCSEVRCRFQKIAPDNIIDLLQNSGWSLMVARNPFVPFKTSVDSRGLAVIIGSTFNSEGPTVSDLRSNSHEQRNQAAHELCRQLNYGVGLSVEDDDCLITTDYLGQFPVYFYKDNATFIVTSIPGMLDCYSGFRPAIDYKGLIGILLLSHGILGRTLFRGVTLLNPSSVLKYTKDGRVEQEKVAMRIGTYAPRNMDEAVEAFDSAINNVMSAAINGSTQLLLSGGLDSRIIAGYLRQHTRGELTAVTLGDPADFEMRGAARVAAVIGARHEKISVTQANFPVFAQRAIDTDAMSSGLYALNMWSLSEKSSPPMLAGFLGDTIMGNSHVEWGREPICDLHTFNAMFTKVNSWGLSPGVIRELVRVDNIDDVILEVITDLKDEYYSYPGPAWQRTLWFELYHRQRILVGRVPKLISYRSWPVMPYFNPAVLSLAVSTPLSLLAERKVQYELIRRKFPELARLPLVGNVASTWSSILPHKIHRWTPYLDRVKDIIVRNVYHDRRSYSVRLYDFNGIGWNILRDQARAKIYDVETWFNQDLLNQLIPPSTTRLKFNLPISETTGRRTLVGAVLCCSQYFTGNQNCTSN